MRTLRAETILERLSALHPKLIDLSLSRIEGLLKRLGDPQLALPPVIHVAGTNGKGSTIAFARAILEAAGYRVHVYISPHLVNFNERIRLAGELICDDELSALLKECEEANDGQPITFFEITTAAAFLAFSRVSADILLLETGLGGRLDATNMVPQPVASVITPISIDHTQFLGNSLAAIAREKAGILKKGVGAIIAAQDHEALEVIERIAGKIGAPLYQQGKDWRVSPTADGMRYEGGKWNLCLPQPGLVGCHQLVNAGTALATLENLPGFDLDETALKSGLEKVEWPGRLQRLISGELLNLVPGGWEIWLDGGHNPAAGQSLAQTLKSWAPAPLHVIYAMLNSKDPAGFLKPFAHKAASLHAIAIDGEAASLSAQEAANIAKQTCGKGIAAQNLKSALTDIIAQEKNRDEKGEKPRILICGSLYLAGAILKNNS